MHLVRKDGDAAGHDGIDNSAPALIALFGHVSAPLAGHHERPQCAVGRVKIGWHGDAGDEQVVAIFGVAAP